jgi:hypothetical protein
MTSTMQTMLMPKDELIAALTKNRADHRVKFLAAQKGYRAKVVEELDAALDRARSGNEIDAFRVVQLPLPMDHTSEYDNAIEMLEMCVDDEIEISRQDYACLVRDEWGWKAAFTTTNSSYGVRP